MEEIRGLENRRVAQPEYNTQLHMHDISYHIISEIYSASVTKRT